MGGSVDCKLLDVDGQKLLLLSCGSPELLPWEAPSIISENEAPVIIAGTCKSSFSFSHVLCLDAGRLHGILHGRGPQLPGRAGG